MTIPAILGHAAGTIYGYARYRVDWAEVSAIVLHGLQVLIVLTLLAGRATRRAWDALPVLSERLGKCYAAALGVAAAAVPAALHPLAAIAAEMEQLTLRELQAATGIRRKVAKHRLIAAALDW
jgi:hypothetical protein